jgi:UDP-glucose 4-epimerase
MRIVVTGGAGFLGSHVVELLLRKQHEVTVLDDLSTGSISNLHDQAQFVRLSVCDSTLADVFHRLRPHAIIHLAAQVSVPVSVEQPGRDAAVNIGGTVNVMTASAAVGARKVVALSSAAVYGVPESLPLSERSRTRPLSPYGLSKLTGEHYVRLLGDKLGVPYTVLRPANIYGPRQTTEGEGAVVPAFLARFLSNRDPVIHGTGEQTRDFIFVTDMARAILQALHLADGATLNISSGVRTSIRELWSELASLLGWDRAPVHVGVRPGDIDHSAMANGAARAQLDWGPRVPLTDGLARTVESWIASSEAAAAREP